MPLTRVYCLIHGRVQGVSFRAATQQQARQLGLTGWVGNRPDGTVEMLAEGDESHVQRLVDWCHHGPSGARVLRVETSWGEAQGDMEGFVIRY